MTESPSGAPPAFAPDGSNQRLLRDAFAKFATGVTVVTCAAQNGPLCITANSFSSISLDPPLVMWAPGKGSGRFEAFRDAERFAIHILSSDQSDLCWACSQDATALRGAEGISERDGLAVIPDCLARFACARVACHDAGDHVIVVGQIEQIEMRDGDALTFFSGRFLQLPCG